MEVLSRVTYDLETNPDIDQWLSVLEAHAEELSAVQNRQVQVIRKNYDLGKRIPADEYVAYSVLLNEAQSVWEKAGRILRTISGFCHCRKTYRK